MGAIASSLVLQSMLPFLRDTARGYKYVPPAYERQAEASDADATLLGLVWTASILLTMSAIVYREQSLSSFDLRPLFSCIGNIFRFVFGVLAWCVKSRDSSTFPRFRGSYTAVSQSDDDDGESAPKKRVEPIHQPPPMRNDIYNMFDPADLPPRLAEYANMVYSACEDLGNFFGFQDSSVRNQAEHLLILLSNNRRYMSSHILPPSVQPPSPIHALHAKVFSNYVKWCRAMGVHPHFSKMNTSMNAPPAVASRVVDLVLYFCVWGEAANLRHMSECLWFLYHRMMEEYVRSEGYTQTRSLYAGHFLDHVVTPIFAIVKTVRCCCCWNSAVLVLFLTHCLLLFRSHAIEPSIQGRPSQEAQLR